MIYLMQSILNSISSFANVLTCWWSNDNNSSHINDNYDFTYTWKCIIIYIANIAIDVISFSLLTNSSVKQKLGVAVIMDHQWMNEPEVGL